MPGRPPKEWFDRCVEEVAAGGRAVNPSAVCGATWRNKSPADKAAEIAMERKPMAAKKRSQHKAKKAKKKTKPQTKAHRSAHRAARSKPKHHHKCPACGHMDKHDAKAGCTHFDGKRFCPCLHRHR